MKTITTDQKEKLIDALVTYSADQFTDMTWYKGRVIKTIYSIIVQAIIDFHSGDKDLKADALKYFEGSRYQQHCEYACIDLDLMDRIVLGVKQYLPTIESYDQDEEEI